MRTRAAILIVNEQMREVLLIQNLVGDHQYYVIPGGAVNAHQSPLTTVLDKIQMEFIFRINITLNVVISTFLSGF